MRGAHRIILQNKRIRYDFEIKRNITVIRGDSATGKTALVDMIREYFENGDASGVELTCDKECTVLEGRTWMGQLSMMKDSIAFIDEGNEFVMSDDFAAAIQGTDNYYVIVTREGIPSLPYSVDEIYGIRNSGKYGTLKRTYNEFYHLYQATGFNQQVKPEKLVRLIEGYPNIVLYLPESFEWIILRSGVIEDSKIAEMLEHPEEYIESRNFFSWERYFTAQIIQSTQDNYLKYSKRQINPAYLQRKISDRILSVMKGIDLT